MKLKRIVLTISKKFPQGKRRGGEPTQFSEKIAKGEKIHTIRRNYDLWRINAERMQQGGYHLSLRQWKGQPYRSTQTEIKKMDAPIGVQRITLNWHPEARELTASVDGVAIDPKMIAKNDGMDMADFVDWFFGEAKLSEPQTFNGVVIHFTPFRYE